MAQEDKQAGTQTQTEVQPKTEPGVEVQSDAFKYSTGLCDICDDPKQSLLGCCCPCLLFGKNAEYAGIPGGYYPSCIAPFVPVIGQLFWCYSSCAAHKRIALQNRKQPNCGHNILCHVLPCCLPCYACQLRREQIKQGGDDGCGPDAASWELGLKAPQR